MPVRGRETAINLLRTFATLAFLVVPAIGCQDSSTTPSTDTSSTPSRDTIRPNVSITAPTDNSTVTDSAVITVSASDNDSIATVGFYIDEKLVHTRSTVPWQYTWDVRNLIPDDVHSIVAKAHDRSNNVGTSGTVRVMVNFTAARWAQVGTAMGDNVPLDFALGGLNLFVGIRVGGVFLSSDNGGSWTPVNNGLSTLNVWSLLLDAGNLFAGTGGGGVFISSNNGASWIQRSTGLTKPRVLALAVIDSNLFAATHFGGNYPGGVFVSTNNGVSWVAAGLQDYNVPAIAVAATKLFAGTSARADAGGGGVFRSTDYGLSWTPVNSGLPNLEIAALAVSGTSLFAGTGAGIFRSTDSGTSWTPVNTVLTNVFRFAVRGGNVFAGTLGDGVFVSTDNGANWTPVNGGLTNPIVTALAVSDSYIFAGTGPGGVWRRPVADVITGLDNAMPTSRARVVHAAHAPHQ